MKIIFLRHGESVGNTWHPAYQQEQYNFLTLRGVKQAELAAYEVDKLLPEIDEVVSSEFLRATQTTSMVMQANDKHRRGYILSGGLNEWWDDPKGKTQDEFKTQVTNFFNDSILPYWESDKTTMIVSHYFTMCMLLDLVKVKLDIIPRVGDLNKAGQHIPNAVPFYLNTKSGRDVDMVIPGFNYRKR